MKMENGLGYLSGLALAGSLIALSMGPAAAHTSVADSNPKDGASVDAAPEEVWVKFGSVPPPGEQPLAISGGHLEVFDACGEQVSSGETQMNELQNQLSVASGGNRAGRYELHWTVEAADGAAQSGSIDFEVTAGDACTRITRVDPKGDVDFGFDVKAVRSSQTRAGATKTQLKLKAPVNCRSFGKSAEDHLQLGFDTNADDADDYSGIYSCKSGSLRLTVTATGDEDGDATVFPVTLGSRNTVLTSYVRASKFSDGDHLDLHAVSSSDAEGCSEEPEEGEEAPVCSDRAPDLGVLRAF